MRFSRAHRFSSRPNSTGHSVDRDLHRLGRGHRDEGGLRWDVESICAQLTELGAKIAPATYYKHRDRRPTAREFRDADLKPKIAAVHSANYGRLRRSKGVADAEPRTPGRRAADRALHRGAEDVRTRVAWRGAGQGQADHDQRPEGRQATRPGRPQLPAQAPDRLWVADFTYVSTWSGWCYTAFVIDAYARRILGWAVATTMTSTFVVDAVEQAI